MPKEFSRTRRIGIQIQRELAQIIQQEMRDPRLRLVTISSVEVARDLSHAKVFVTAMDATEDTADAMVKVLNHAAGFIRHALGQRLIARIIPELHFVYDTALERGLRVAALIEAVSKEHKEHDDNEK